MYSSHVRFEAWTSSANDMNYIMMNCGEALYIRYFLIFSLMFAEIKHVYPDAPGMHRNQMFVRSNIQYIHFCLRIGSRYKTGWWFQTCFIFRPIIDDYLVGGLEHFFNE